MKAVSLAEVGWRRLEDGRVDAVVDDLDGIGPEEGFLHEVSQPLRWRDEDKLPQAREQLLLARKVLTAVV